MLSLNNIAQDRLLKVDPMKIRADVIRTYQKVYTWTVIIAGLFSGSLTMFKPAIEQWAVPKSQIIAQTPIDEIDQLVIKATHKF